MNTDASLEKIGWESVEMFKDNKENAYQYWGTSIAEGQQSQGCCIKTEKPENRSLGKQAS